VPGLKLFQTYRGLPQSVYIIFIAQIINRFGDFVRPFLTLFLTTYFGYSVAMTGIFVMLNTLVSVPGSFLGGRIADHYGRKKAYLFFQSLAGLTIFLCAFFYKHPLMIGLIMASSFFGGAVRPIISAILADVLSPEDRQRGFSLSYLGINIGVALGPIVAGFLFNHFLIMIFIGDALTSAIAVLLVALRIKESLPTEGRDEVLSREEAHATGSVLSVLIKRPILLAFLFFNIFLSASYIQVSFSFPLILGALFGTDAAPIFGSLMSFNAIVVIVMTLAITKFSTHFRPITNIAIASSSYIVGFGFIGMITHLPLFWVTTFIWTLGEILMSINFGVFIVNQTPQNFRARFNAVSSLSFAVGSILGTAIVGQYIDHYDVYSVWYLVAGLSTIGTLGMLFVRRLVLKGEAQKN